MLLNRFKNILDRQTRLKRAYLEVFKSPAGEMVLQDILLRCGMLEVSTVPGDPSMSAFRDGRKSIGLDLMHQMRWSEAELMQLALARTADALGAEQQEANDV